MKDRFGPLRIWALLLAGPLLFLVAIVLVSVAITASGTPPDLIGAAVAAWAAEILAAVLAVLGVLVVWLLPLRDLWALPGPQKALADTVIGAVTGAVIALAYLHLLAPLLVLAQTNLGDYVPPGAVLETVSAGLGMFFLANVLLAPWVEESLYRGFALRALTPRFGVLGAVVLGCLAFGLLHWTGGLWYMVLTGVVAGGAFSVLALLRGGLLAPFAAHLTLNLIEFAATW
jgi:membrane protease YdiL (CAAX protease family)